MAGIETLETYTAKEILGYASEIIERRPCTIESGVGSLLKGTVIGKIPTTKKFSDYDKDEVASAGAITAGGGKAKTMALRICENLPMALPATAPTWRSGRSRSFQSLR